MWGWELKADSAASKRALTWSGSEMSALTVTARGFPAVEEEEEDPVVVVLMLLIREATRLASDELEE